MSSALDDSVQLWDLATGQQVFRLPGHGRSGGTRAVGFTADGQSFVSFVDEQPTATDARLAEVRDRLQRLKDEIVRVQEIQAHYQPGYQAHGFVWLFLRRPLEGKE